MKDNIFWDKKLSNKQIKKILLDENNPRFVEIAALLLSRSNMIHEIFKNYLEKGLFCRNWNKIKRTMRKNKWDDRRITYWNEIYKVIYEDIPVESKKEKLHPIHEEAKKFGSTIRNERKNRGLKQTELAKQAGISQTHISFIERGFLNFSVDTLLKVASVLDLELILIHQSKLTTSSTTSETSN